MKKIIFILIALISFSQAQTIQYIGAPTTTVISRGNFRTDSIFYLPKRTKTPTDTAAFRYQISDSSLYYWTGYQWTKVQSSSSFASVDTNIISTRAWRQKGDDSLGAIIATKGSGTVTSVATGYGLSGGTITTTGTLIADTALVASRLRLGKVADSLSLVKQNVLTNPVTGTGTTNYVPKFTGTSTIGNSLIQDNGAGVGIGGSQLDRLTIFEDQNSTTSLRVRNSDAGSSAYAMIGVNASGNSWGFRMGSIAANNNALDIVQDAFGTPTSRIRFFNNGRISVNSTTDAGFTFDVTGITRTTGNTFLATSSAEVYVNTTSDAGAYTLQNNGALYNTGSAILAATSGNVGIGTASPTSKADILGTLRIRNTTFVQPTDGAGIELSFRSSDSTGYLATYSRDYSAYRNQAYFSLSHRFYSGTGGSDALFITSSSESLFGTTTDAGNYRVQVSGATYISDDISLRGTYSPVSAANRGNITLNGTASNIIAFANNSALRGYIFHTDSDFLFYNNTTGGRVGLYTEGTARLWITANGATGIGTTSPSASALLDLSSTTRGFLPPRMTSTERDAISSPAAGLVIYNTTTSKLQVYTTSWTDLH